MAEAWAFSFILPIVSLSLISNSNHILERSLDNVDLNINVLISTPEERPPLLKGHFW